MAEATSMEAGSDRANGIHTTYLENPGEIAGAFRSLRDQRASLRLTFENETGICTARILDVLDTELLLEDLMPRSALGLMSARRRFALSARAAGIYLYAENNRTSRIDEDRGVPFFRVPLPVSALFQQRRRTTRYQVPLRADSKPTSVAVTRAVITDKDHAGRLTGRLLDVSAGGCRLAIQGPVHPPMEKDEILRGCVIQMPGLYEVNAEAVIRHASYNKLTRKVICGLEFTGMQVTDRRRLTHFIQLLSRVSDQA